MDELTGEEALAAVSAIETQIGMLNDLMMQTKNVVYAIEILESAKHKIEKIYKGN